MPPTSRPRAWALAGALALLGAFAPARASAQSMPPYVPVQPDAAWQTMETPHFVFHFPAALAEWTRDAASRMESEREAVRRLVGYVPVDRVTVLVADPYNASNGSAYPFLRAPAVFLWPVPDDPRSQLGASRRWSEMLTVHEYAHVAHLARPSRNPLRRTLAGLLPTNIGPIGATTPRWVWEGYATYVEGRLTGTGRPYGVWRPAYLRQWAIEGRLPSYAQVSGTGGFAAGSFAYLAGSAYFEWLVAQRGDSSLPAVWRRMTARTTRSFDAAFAGVFPGTPAELYARWSAQVTAEAIATERALTTAGLVEGTLVQRLRSATGDPAVSPDGERVALVVRTPGRASRVVVWRTGAEPRDTSRIRVARQAVSRARRLDPEDVLAVPYLPGTKRALATLPSRDGRPFANPRWLPDGARLLLERDEPLPDGPLRPDLWLWDTRAGSVRRLTRGAAVHDADPAPDGRSAIATRCIAGWCDLVRVDLTTGRVATLAAGSPERTYARPRWSADGRRLAVVTQDDGRWHVLVGDMPEGAGAPSLRTIGPDDGASRYDPTFLPGGRALLVTSERGGVPNIERVDLPTGSVRTLTRVTGAAFAPEPIGRGGALYFLALRSTGFDLRRLTLDSLADVAPLTLAGRPAGDTGGSAGAMPPLAARIAVGPGAATAAGAVGQRVAGAAPDTFAVVPPSAPRGYGIGPTHVSLLPAGAWTPDGNSVSGVLTGADPVGRLTWVLTGAAGAPATWRGGSLSAAYRGLPATVDGQTFGITQRSGASGTVRYHGGVLALASRVALGPSSLGGRLGGSVGRLDVGADPARARSMGFGELRAGTVRGRGDRVVSLAIAGTGAAGRSADSTFTRWLGSVGVAARTPLLAARASYARGDAGRSGAAFERFLVGGPEPALVDVAVLGQRVAMPALPTGALAGRRIETARVGLGGSLLEPYAWAGRAADVSHDWLRVVGAEASFVTGPIPFARAPGVRAVAGVGYPLDGPTRHRLRAYATVAVRP